MTQKRRVTLSEYEAEMTNRQLLEVPYSNTPSCLLKSSNQPTRAHSDSNVIHQRDTV
jgi:hypothetical protein